MTSQFKFKTKEEQNQIILRETEKLLKNAWYNPETGEIITKFRSHAFSPQVEKWEPGELKALIDKNRDIRSELFDKGAYELVRRNSKFRFLQTEMLKAESDEDKNQLLALFGYSMEEYERMKFEYSHMDALRKNRARRRQRVAGRIELMVMGGEAVFVTLTFTDEIFARTSAATRKVYVKRFLASVCKVYVANIDFGKKNEREHFHAVVGSRFDPTTWKYGNCDVKAIRYGNSDRVGKYITKLSFHAIKTPQRVIFSRNFLT